MTRTQPHPDDGFYAALPAFERFEDIAEPAVYAAVPGSWHILVTDVAGSTRAIAEGRYKDVNALGASTIIAVANRIPDVPLPYVFGGDGATVLVPPGRRAEAEEAARGVMALARDAFGLELRAGMVPVAEAAGAGLGVRVARFRVSRHVTLAMFEGGGLTFAERVVKDPVLGKPRQLAPADRADPRLFSGFECRWKPIHARKDRIASLLVSATAGDAAAQRAVYRRVLGGIAATARRGVEDLRPVQESSLALADRPGDFRVEASVRTGRPSGLGFRLWTSLARFNTRLGTLAFKRGWKFGRFDGARYPGDLVANTDFRKFDDTLRMVVDVSLAELAALEAYLEGERADGAIVYGLHASASALMTCYIRDYSGDHVHFVDGSDGGYALATRQMKEQARARAGA